MPHPPAQPIEHRRSALMLVAGFRDGPTTRRPPSRALRSQKNLVQFPRSQSPTDQIDLLSVAERALELDLRPFAPQNSRARRNRVRRRVYQSHGRLPTKGQRECLTMTRRVVRFR